jgi:hypothetical protein
VAQVRNVTASPLFLVAAGREVAPDELCEVPDAVFAALVWPESTWAVVAEPAPKKEK